MNEKELREQMAASLAASLLDAAMDGVNKKMQTLLFKIAATRGPDAAQMVSECIEEALRKLSACRETMLDVAPEGTRGHYNVIREMVRK